MKIHFYYGRCDRVASRIFHLVLELHLRWDKLKDRMTELEDSFDQVVKMSWVHQIEIGVEIMLYYNLHRYVVKQTILFTAHCAHRYDCVELASSALSQPMHKLHPALLGQRSPRSKAVVECVCIALVDVFL
jgi:hypothetical protein